MMKQERPYPERRLRGVLEELASACSKYGTLTQGKSGGGASAGRTKLDKERVKLCQREVVCKLLLFYNILKLILHRRQIDPLRLRASYRWRNNV